jgi:hypothetical protein
MVIIKGRLQCIFTLTPVFAVCVMSIVTYTGYVINVWVHVLVTLQKCGMRSKTRENEHPSLRVY